MGTHMRHPLTALVVLPLRTEPIIRLGTTQPVRSAVSTR